MAKKIISFLVAAMMVLSLVPAAAFAKTTPAHELRLQPVEKADNVSARGLQEAEPVKDDEALITWDFEEDPTTSGWNFIDADNDGKNWTWTTETNANSGTHAIKSASYESGALTPDNWAQSPYFDMPEGGATLTFQVKNYIASYPEVFEVWYGFEGGPGMNPVATNQSVTGSDWVEVSYQIPDSEGARGMIAIRHYGCTDMWKFYIDDVEISAPADPYMIPTVEVDGFPHKIYAGQTPDDVLANITIPDDAHYMITEISAYDVETESQLDGGDQFEEGKSYLLGVSVETDLDYYFAEDAELLANGGALELDIGYSGVTTYTAFVVPVEYVCGGEAPLYGWYFETEDELEGWGLIDNDGDDSNWYWLNNNSFGADNYDQYAYEGEGFVGSPSWNTVALTPDNYLLTPELEIPEGTTTLSFYAAGLGANWCEEHFAVYAVPEGASTVDEFIEIIPETVATADYVNYTADLSNYAGQSICVAFRHFNCTDLNWLRLDQVEIFNEGGDEPEPIIIDTIEINDFVEPEWGANPFYGVTVPEDAHYSKIQGLWYRYNASGPMNPDDTFNDPDEQYYMYFFFVPMEGYEFADDVTVLINGSAALVFFSTAENGGISVYTNYFTVEEPSAGDLDEALNVEGGELHFETSEDYPWETFTDGDRLAAWSTNKGVSSSTSAVWTTVTANEGDVLSFDFMAWGEGTGGEVGISSVWDKCEFYVDEELVLKVGALQNDWTTYTYTFTSSGEHTLTWQYVKDSSLNPTGDYFAIDEVQVTEGTVPPTDVPPTEEPPTNPPTGEPVEGLIVGYYFETQEEVNEWTFVGGDTNWVWSFDNPGSYDYTELAHEGEGFIMSYSFVDYVGAYQANNWAISPAVTLPNGTASVSFYASNANASYPETFSVYVGTTPNTADMTLLQTITPTTGYDDEWSYYEIDLSDYAGQTIYLAFYDGCYDMYEIWIDQVEFWGESGEQPPVPTILGDVDLDGTVEVEDAILALRYAMGLIELTDEQLAQADVDGDGDYDLVDATLILRFAMGLIDEFPIPEPVYPIPD